MARLTQIKASAGSGKTFELTGRFLRLLGQCEPGRISSACLGSAAPPALSDILAVTFTNAAAQEMRDRVIKHLKLAALGTGQNSTPNMRPEAARAWVNRIVRDLGSLNIRTIDSLSHLIVRAAALDLNLLPDFRPVFSSEAALAPYLDALIDRAEEDENLRALLAAACGAIAVQSKSGGFLSGDRLLTRLRDIFGAALLGNYDGLSSGEEIAGLCARLGSAVSDAAGHLLEIADARGLPWNKTALAGLKKAFHGTDYTSKYLQRENAGGLFIKNAIPPPEVEAAFVRLQESLSAWNEAGPALNEALRNSPFVQLARTLALAFRSNLENEGDLPALLVDGLAQQALHGENGVPDTLCRLGTRLRHFLLDEFQDTSRVQWQTLKPLVHEALSRGGSLTCVGDVKQSIYGWRGGTPELFDAVFEDEDLSRLAPDVVHSVLPCNWRSLAEVAEHNNAFFSPLQDTDIARRVLGAMLPGDTPEDILDEAARTAARTFTDCGQQVPEGRHGGFVRTEILAAGTSDELNETVMERLVRLLREDIIPRRSPADVLVLVRTNGQAAAAAERLTGAGLPVITEMSLLLSSHPLIAQTVAMLTFLDDPSDDIAFWTALTGSIVREHPEAGLTWEEAHNLELASPLAQSFRTVRPAIWNTLFEPFLNLAGLMSPYDLTQEWFARLDVEARFPEDGTFLRRFLEVLFSAEEKGMGDTASFLEHWLESGCEEKVPLPENMEAVRVTTIHKAKGLEAPLVILPWTDFAFLGDREPEVVTAAGLRLAVRPLKTLGRSYYVRYARQARENLHLLYVALTRAQEELYIFRASADTQANRQSLCKGMDALWQAAGFSPPYTCGTILETAGPPRTEKKIAAADRERPRFPASWRPMDWLPRLKIHRKSLVKP